MRATGIAAAVVSMVAMACRPAPPTSGTEAQVRKVLSQALPGMDGRGLRLTVLEVTLSQSGWVRQPAPS